MKKSIYNFVILWLFFSIGIKYPKAWVKYFVVRLGIVEFGVLELIVAESRLAELRT